MKRYSRFWPAFLTGMALTALTLAQQPPQVVSFSPEGVVKNVRQVQARFSEPMVPLGDLREEAVVFFVDCPEEGAGRWVDSRSWVYDFERDLPAGVRCEFRLDSELRTLSGSALEGRQVFSFSTGGPAVFRSDPWEGSDSIDEEQIFILTLDGEPDEESVLRHAYFTVEGIGERIGVRIVSGEEREAILKTRYRWDGEPERTELLIQARRRFPAGARVSLVWDSGVESLSGVATATAQVFHFRARHPFSATFRCQRENPDSDCVPFSSMNLTFSAPVAWSQAGRSVLRGPGGREWTPEGGGDSDGEGPERYVHGVEFKGPFPQRSEFILEIAPGLVDDAGRPLNNADRFPLLVRTAEYPPLAKFAAPFGILELKAGAVLPVTVRNLEVEIQGSQLTVAGPVAEGRREILSGELEGRILKIAPDRVDQVVAWLQTVTERRWEDRERSVFDFPGLIQSESFSLPKPHGAQAFEVMGIPLNGAGFYVVELQSQVLGESLLGKPQPMFVPAAALVTDLSVHFKWGAEASLVWVTELDSARPVGDADLQVRDCEGRIHWTGKTDAHGLARINRLPNPREVPSCAYSSLDGGLLVVARKGEDLSFAHSSWQQGIEPWRFRLGTEYDYSLVTAHTVFDRTLLRAGETVHMKHFLRKRSTSGFVALPGEERPLRLILQHQGSDERYELPLEWQAGEIAETSWEIPREARLGTYSVYMSRASEEAEQGGFFWGSGEWWRTGEFRVEEFRIPLMTGTVVYPSEPLVSPSEVPIDLTVRYLAGGGAGRLPVRFRYTLQRRGVAPFPGFDDFLFARGRPREGLVRRGEEPEQEERVDVRSLELTLDETGGTRALITDLPPVDHPREIAGELEFRDPNGEVQTLAARIPLWSSPWVVGVKLESWTSIRDSLKFPVAVVDVRGQPVPGAPVQVDLLERKTYSHRKRLVGGFYAYEHYTEVRRLGTFCQGRTGENGILECEGEPPISGNVIVEASATPESGAASWTQGSVWVRGDEHWWFDAEDHDRIDLLTEKKRYEPGETARFQVRMPFREATALVSVEREGVGEVFVRRLSGTEPVIEVPVQAHHAPNVYVSVLAVRGRVGGVQPTATVDLGRPAFKLGIAEIQVGWQSHELKVSVATDREVYRVRDKVQVSVSVRSAGGGLPPRGSEVALVAVDEGLLELMPNPSWDLLEKMMGVRRYAVYTATAQMHVIGKRHFGLKALPQGGGGGRQPTRELFDTLLFWQARLPLDRQGNARAEIPLNDSLTSFRIVAVATGGLDRFGTGSATVRSTQDLMILPGLAPLVREGDRFSSEFTVRNTSQREMEVEVSARIEPVDPSLASQTVRLAPGEARQLQWEVTAPVGVSSLRYEVAAADREDASDRLVINQKVVPAVPVRTLQATLAQVDPEVRLDVAAPVEALPGRGGLKVVLQPSLLAGLDPVRQFMDRYPYTCLEQKVSRAVATRDEPLWENLQAVLPTYLDSDGLLRYFSGPGPGSDVLTSYVLAVVHEAGWEIPEEPFQRMLEGLRGFVEGRVVRHGPLRTTDLALRKLAAVEALSRWGAAESRMLSSVVIEPNLWPTPAVLDWLNVLLRLEDFPNRAPRWEEAETILRSRLDVQGTALRFSPGLAERMEWLMISGDVTSARLILTLLEAEKWTEDLPRLMRGFLGRQQRGRWDLTTANAWGTLATEKFTALFEAEEISGGTLVELAGQDRLLTWEESPEGGEMSLSWPAGRARLVLTHEGTGRPWAVVQSQAAVPLQEPLSSGFRIHRTLVPVEQKEPGRWSRGDVVRVRLELEAQAPVTWVVVDDPVPGGASVLGTGLGRDSRLAVQGEERRGWVWPAFEERSFEAFRAYYRYVPKGEWTVEYTLRLNSEGIFNLPATRVEALYAPEMFAELPNEVIRVGR